MVVGEPFLCFDIDGDSGLEADGEVIGEDVDLPVEFSGQAIIKFCDVGFLTTDEVLQLVDALPGLLAAAGVCLGL